MSESIEQRSSGEERPGHVRVETVAHLVEHLDRGHGHALLTGPRGFGLGTALQTCCSVLAERGRTVEVLPAHVLSADLAETWPPLGPEHVAVLDARHGLASVIVPDALRAATAAGAQLLVVAPSSEDAETSAASIRTHGGTVFVLRPWGQAEIGSFLAERGHSGRDVAQVARLTGGLPWVLRYVGATREDDPLAGGSGAPAPERVAAFVANLLDSCDPTVGEAVIALAVGYPMGGDPPLPVASPDHRTQDRLVRAVEAAGLIGSTGGLPPLVRETVLRHAPSHQVERARRRLVDDVVMSGQDLAAWAPDLVRRGSTDDRVVEALVSRSRRDLAGPRPDRRGLTRSAELLRTAQTSGARSAGLHAELCRLALLRGDLDAAARSLDLLLARDEDGIPPGTLAVGIEVAAAMDLPHLGENVIRWVCARAPGSADHPAVALTRYAAGDRAGGDAVLARAVEHAAPEHSAGVLLAEGVQASLRDDPAGALPALMQALAAWGPSGAATDDPAAVVALWGLHTGDLRLVESTVRTATEEPGLAPVLHARLVVLGAWAAMCAGRLDEALAAVDSLAEVAPRERLWVCAIRAGVARRRDEHARLRAEWEQARDVLLSHPVGLWQLLPLGELGLAAARMRSFEAVRPLWERASALLASLGEPPLWATPFHWYAVQVALQLDEPPAVAPHAAALVRAARHWPRAAVLSSAGRAWVRVRARDVEADEVERSARALARASLPWEGARLASHGAGAAPSRRVRDRLNECAREILPSGSPGPVLPASDRGLSGAVGRSLPGSDSSGIRLTDRERQVAELVLAGRTYRQIGEVLYLSPKTVEHHMARMRRRSGAATRAELLELLLATVAQPSPPEPAS